MASQGQIGCVSSCDTLYAVSVSLEMPPFPIESNGSSPESITPCLIYSHQSHVASTGQARTQEWIRAPGFRPTQP